MGYSDREYSKLTHHSYNLSTSTPAKRAREEEEDTAKFHHKRSKANGVEMAITQAFLEDKVEYLKNDLAAKQAEIHYLIDQNRAKDKMIRKKERVIDAKERIIEEKNNEIGHKDILIRHKEKIIQELRSAEFNQKKSDFKGARFPHPVVSHSFGLLEFTKIIN
ncbi:hypothetical protein L486_03734 [Kwoniella mangroviensis CBS 10435]|uniref:Uncharacterized protein n=1 Tax=Kwoniella mangroviensis CBS 10435 TaxID=1331196 RepID=A0A1B9IUL3_9TREE|nr:uncharacterized protein I203_02420 [Kwoniella mangroviensis CBS 8507]OCF59231.1 hypothetical protein L486_03734 [Kwoniella mangroviensis CBS 10435]OCF69024.1 hypothetical protein I203_02420 [Kwoniella mangroviensis CBS 8507]